MAWRWERDGLDDYYRYEYGYNDDLDDEVIEEILEEDEDDLEIIKKEEDGVVYMGKKKKKKKNKRKEEKTSSPVTTSVTTTTVAAAIEKEETDKSLKSEKPENVRFAINIEFNGRNIVLEGRKIEERSYYYYYSSSIYSSYYSYNSDSSNVDVDLTKIIDDMSKNPIEYVEGAIEVIKKLKTKDKVTFGCRGGCGRTFTVLLLVLSAVYGSKEKVLEKYKEALKQADDNCPEIDTQYTIAAASIIYSEGKRPLENDSDFAQWTGGIIGVGKGWIENEKVEQLKEELKSVADKYRRWKVSTAL